MPTAEERLATLEADMGNLKLEHERIFSKLDLVGTDLASINSRLSKYSLLIPALSGALLVIGFLLGKIPL